MGDVLHLREDEKPTVDTVVRGPTTVFQNGAEFGKYRIQHLVGRGGMSEVYEALHTGLKKRVAIKALRPEFLSRENMVQRFLREGENAARIQHPHVVDTIDVGRVDGVPYLVMEFLEGEALGDVFVREDRLSLERTADLMLPVMAAVSSAHEQGVIHRDLKPDNVMLASGTDGRLRPKVMDFGVSRLLDADATDKLTIDRGVLGTPHYMSPEQARGEVAGTKSDQYSLGVMLYEAVTGRLPHDRESILELLQIVSRGQFDPPSRFRPDLPAAFESLVLRAMSPQPADRFRSVREFGAELLPFASDRVKALWSPEFSPDERTKSEIPPPMSGNHTPSLTHTTPAGLISSSSLLSAAPTTSSAAAPASEKRFPWLAIVALLLLAGGVGGFFVWKNKNSATPEPQAAAKPGTFEVKVMATPASAAIQLDGKPVATGAFASSLPKDGTVHELVVTAAGFQSRSVKFTDVSPPQNIALEPEAAAESSAEPEVDESNRRAPTAARRAKRRAKQRPTGKSASDVKSDSTPTKSPTLRPASDNKDPWKSGKPTPKSDNKDPWAK